MSKKPTPKPWRAKPGPQGRVSLKGRVPEIKDWAKIRTRILDRDGYACRICRNDGDGAALNVHHIDWDRENNQDSNLVTLCAPCHQAVHREGYKPALYEDWPTPWGKLE